MTDRQIDVFFNEAREIPFSLITAAISRLGRFPAEVDAPLTWSGITKPMPEHHWYWDLAGDQARARVYSPREIAADGNNPD